MRADDQIYDSSEELFEKVSSREKFKSNRFRELALDYATDTSVRQSAKRLNRLRLENKGIIPTTLRNLVEREGEALQKHMVNQSEKALESNGFNKDGTAIGNK